MRNCASEVLISILLDCVAQNANKHRPWKLTASTKRCTEEVFEIHVRLALSKGLTSQSSTTHTHIYNQPPLHINFIQPETIF
ncbi:hypothetical protein ACLKA7_004559 [Drosophila subpalustris]